MGAQSDGVWKLTGLETEGAAPLDASALGSMYSAPELGKTYGVSADVFSLGMLLFAIWSTLDVNDEDALVWRVEKLKDSVANGTAMPDKLLEKASSLSFGPELRTIIMSMVAAEPASRPSSAHACNQIKHCLEEHVKQLLPGPCELEAPAPAQRSVFAKCCQCFSPSPVSKEDA